MLAKAQHYGWEATCGENENENEDGGAVADGPVPLRRGFGGQAGPSLPWLLLEVAEYLVLGRTWLRGDRSEGLSLF